LVESESKNVIEVEKTARKVADSSTAHRVRVTLTNSSATGDLRFPGLKEGFVYNWWAVGSNLNPAIEWASTTEVWSGKAKIASGESVGNDLTHGTSSRVLMLGLLTVFIIILAM